MSELKLDRLFFRSLERSSVVKNFVYYNTERLVNFKGAGNDKNPEAVDHFYHACRVVQNLGSRIGSALGAELQEIEYDGAGERGLFRRYDGGHFLVVVTERRIEALLDELEVLEKQAGLIEDSTEEISYRGSGLLNWIFRRPPE